MTRRKSAEAALTTPHQRLLIAALMFAFACGLSMAARAAHVIDHDKVQGFPDSTSGFLKTFQPYLQVHDGCVPFPAVDAAGNVSGGLKPSGLFAYDGCSRNLGQIYVRGAEYRGECGVMYSWFFPKEQIPSWPHKHGSRYNWEHVVVWLTSCDIAKRRLTPSATGAMIVTTSRHICTWMEHIRWSPIVGTCPGNT